MVINGLKWKQHSYGQSVRNNDPLKILKNYFFCHILLIHRKMAPFLNFSKFCQKWILSCQYFVICVKENKARRVKSVHIRSISDPHFPTFGLNTEKYSVSFRNQSECGKIRTRKTTNMDIFHAVAVVYWGCKSLCFTINDPYK